MLQNPKSVGRGATRPSVEGVARAPKNRQYALLTGRAKREYQRVAAFTVRRAGPGDESLVASLNRHVHDLHVAAEPQEFHPAEVGEVQAFFAAVLASPTHLVFVAESAGPIGYIWADELHRRRNAFKNERHLVYIHHIAVAPEHRRTGAGAALYRAVESEARERGLTDLALDHWSFNNDAAVFFRKLGFQNYNVRMRTGL